MRQLELCGPSGPQEGSPALARARGLEGRAGAKLELLLALPAGCICAVHRLPNWPLSAELVSEWWHQCLTAEETEA